MNNLNTWSEIWFSSLKELGTQLVGALPDIFGAILLLIIGWMLARFFAYLTVKFLKSIKFDKRTDKLGLGGLIKKANLKINPGYLIGRFVYWVVLLFFLAASSETLGWSIISESITGLIAYLPRLFVAIIIFVIGFYIANLIRQFLKTTFVSFKIASGDIISTFAYIIILVIVTLTALDQAGIDTTVITANLSMIIGAVLLAFGIGFGIASREIFQNILSSHYSRNSFEEGQRIRLKDGTEGVIEKIDSLMITLKTNRSLLMLPAKTLVEQQVEILPAD